MRARPSTSARSASVKRSLASATWRSALDTAMSSAGVNTFTSMIGRCASLVPAPELEKTRDFWAARTLVRRTADTHKPSGTRDSLAHAHFDSGQDQRATLPRRELERLLPRR